LSATGGTWTGITCAVVTVDSGNVNVDDDIASKNAGNNLANSPVAVDEITVGRRQTCLKSMAALFEAIDSKLAQSLAFCRCTPHLISGGSARLISSQHFSAMMVACEAAKVVVRPACSLVELPPPSCSDILRRCMETEDCRFVGDELGNMVVKVATDIVRKTKF
jgi:hypothetical protein